MTTRIILNGRVRMVANPDALSRFRNHLPVRENGEVADGSPVAPPAKALVLGVPYFHPSDKITYRVLAVLSPADGWGSSDFWQARWNVDHKAVISFVTAGFVDAAMEAGSGVTRFRVRDELGLKESKAWKDAKNRLLRTIRNRRKLERKEGGHAHANSSKTTRNR